MFESGHGNSNKDKKREVYMKTKRCMEMLVAAAIVLASAMSVQAAMTWDAYTGFNSASNTTSDLWQYMRAAQGANDGYWLLPVYGSLDGIGVSWHVQNNFPAVGAAEGEIRVHPELPGTTSSAAVIGWKSPITGNVDVSFLVTDRNAGANGPGDWPLVPYDGVTYNLFRKGDVTALSSGYVVNGYNSGTINVSNVAVSPGTMLYLQIGSAVDNHWYDLTGVNLTITQVVPEPAAAMLLLAGCAAGLIRRRK